MENKIKNNVKVNDINDIDINEFVTGFVNSYKESNLNDKLMLDSIINHLGSCVSTLKYTIPTERDKKIARLYNNLVFALRVL